MDGYADRLAGNGPCPWAQGRARSRASAGGRARDREIGFCYCWRRTIVEFSVRTLHVLCALCIYVVDSRQHLAMIKPLCTSTIEVTEEA